ncbi:MAG TPA: alpha/beta hydrolase [Anaerolineales bacterium]|nr:alpha/beta hydrolase [Anaerolineales bacterium]
MAERTSEKTHFTRRGDGRPVILVHGMGGSLNQWDALSADLAGAGCEVIALDLFGHGDSPKSHAGDGYHIDDIYTHFETWLDALDLPRAPVLVGHSLGAYLSLNYALRRKTRIGALIFASPFFSPRQLSRPIRLSLENVELGKTLLRLAPQWTIASALRIAEMNGERLTRPVRDNLARDYKKFDPGVFESARTARNLVPQLHRIEAPAMVVWGERDLTLAPESFPELCERLPHADMRKLPGGHIPHLTDSARFNRSVLEFIKKLPSAETFPGQRRSGAFAAS